MEETELTMESESAEHFLARRKQRCMDRIAAMAAAVTDPPREAPTVEFMNSKVSTGPRGEYKPGKKNRIVLRVKGFLDDPSIPDSVVDAVVAHELGHWADPRRRRDGYYGQSAMAVSIFITLVFVGAGYLMWDALGSFAGALAGLLLVAMCVSGISRSFLWPGEYTADAFAAKILGPTPIIEMIEMPVPGTDSGNSSFRWSPTHPPTSARVLRLQRDFCGQ